MTHPGRHGAPRAGSVLAGLAAIALLSSAVTPLVPAAHAADASPSPAASASDSPADSPAVSPDASPTTTPSPDPSPAPAPTPSPDPAPAPIASPSPSPTPIPSAAASPSATPGPSPTPGPTAPPSLAPSPSPAALVVGPLSPGQRGGTDVASPIPVYKLVAPQAIAADAAAATGFVSPHTGLADSLTSDACAACHSGHSAQSPSLLIDAPPMSAGCFQCHDSTGTGSTFATQAEYAAAGVKANDPTTDSYYQHPSTVADAHTSGSDDEFGGKLDRHAACADCHQPHRADGTAPTQSTGGWGASGAIVGASGVIVTNTAGAAAPAYSFTPGGITFEYQLCLKCHSGFTKLPAQDPAHPSRWALDKGIELDPLNAESYHPIEAAGTNQTAAMAASLSGTSPNKLWDFGVGDTVRCTSCHAGPVAPAKGTPADATLAPHASANRGILVLPYRDRQLKAPTGDGYDAGDFALCYACHAEAPFLQATGTDSLAATNFKGTPSAAYGATFQSLHALHLTQIAGKGAGSPSTDIDAAGAGQGDAICAECHFRLHSTDQAYWTSEQANTRLVNFAPNVQGVGPGAQPTWTSTGVASGSCTLTCHGHQHSATTYGP